LMTVTIRAASLDNVNNKSVFTGALILGCQPR
jgi:hypothetical protein